jgi:integrase
MVQHNEAAYTNVPPVADARTRVLKPDEMRIIWNALDETEVMGAAIKLIMLTACRCGEISKLIWGEVDLMAKQINLPGTRMKNHHPHIVPLSEQALEILKARPRGGDQDPIFPGRNSGKGLTVGTYHKQTIEGRILAMRGKPLEPWIFHDFRRAASTWMNDNDVDPAAVEAILAHHSGGIAGVYNRAEYLAKRRLALERWADVITGESTGRVVNLRN